MSNHHILSRRWKDDDLAGVDVVVVDTGRHHRHTTQVLGESRGDASGPNRHDEVVSHLLDSRLETSPAG